MKASTYLSTLDILRRFRARARAKAAQLARPLRARNYCPATGQGYRPAPTAAEQAADDMLAALGSIDPAWFHRRQFRRPDSINADALARVVRIVRRKIRQNRRIP